jgi:hypothetical protein
MQLTSEDLKHGDHIYVKRSGRLYSHHGIYTGERTVIHYKGEEKEKKDPMVTETSLTGFLKGGKLKRRDYKKRFPLSDTLRIAREQLSIRDYSLAFNNCEHFATFCATGKKKSKQTRKIFRGIIGVTFAVTAIVIRRKKTKEQGA